MIRKKIVGISIGGVLLFIFSESLIVLSIRKFGAIFSFSFFTIIFSLLSIWLLNLYRNHQKNHSSLYLVRLQRWIKSTEENKNQKIVAIYKVSKLAAVFFSAIIFGIFVSTIIIGSVERRGPMAYYYILLTNVIFFAFWILFYSGAFVLISNLFISK